MTAQHGTEFGIVVAAGQRYARWYDDGPSSKRYDGSDPIEVERAFRAAFIDAAREVAAWGEPACDVVEAAWAVRREAYEGARVLVPSADYFGITDKGQRARYIGEQVVYRLGHAVVAARARGRHQAVAMTFDAWLRLSGRGLADEQIVEVLIPAWLAEVEAWATTGDPSNIAPPLLDQTEAAREAAAKEAAPPMPETTPAPPPFISARDLLAACPSLRPAVIERLLREGETMNVIASPKTGKSWLVLDLAIAVATGRPWLGRFATTAGDVLIIDNELHGETSANRIPKVAKARGVAIDDFADRLFVRNLRGGLQDIVTLGAFFRDIEPGRFRLIVLDAFYRFLPSGMDENANADMAMLYNHIDRYAADLRCSFVLIHHATKGNQSGKAVTDVGAGAGSQSRATDAHLVLRPHEENDVVVLEAAVRSWPPLDGTCLRWAFPVWDVAEDLDPRRLKIESPRRRQRSNPPPAPDDWTPERFVGAFVTGAPALRDEILHAATKDLSHAQATRLLKLAEARGLVRRSQAGPSDRVRFVVARQPESGQ
ncbi:MAG: AAA family ATPase [Phycisphaeraceae bacterium]|nr:AAA family ATPase [Phycisphaerales bacterium]QOJ17133.1 MAG: AAA family ATPase [Phycisphaeraceae bacterium]